MNFSRFFVDRPVFAGVLSVLIFVAGLIGMTGLPISEYPEVVPPQIVVRAQYPGANPPLSPRRWRHRSKNRSTASKACSTCRARRPPTA